MADETTTPTTTETTTTETPPAANKTFTQDEVNRLVGKARAEGAQSAAKKNTQPTPDPVVETDADRPTLKGLQAELAETKARAAFDKRAAKLGLSDEIAEDLFSLSQVQKPTDLGTWMETKAKLFAGAPNVNSSPATPATPAPTPTPAAAPTAPQQVNPVTSGGVVNLFAMTDAQISAMSPTEVRGHFEKILDVARSQSGGPPKPTPPTRR